MENLGFVGFGEAPSNLIRGIDRSMVNLYAYDAAVANGWPRGEVVIDSAKQNNVTLVNSLEELTEVSDIIFNFTSANVCKPIAESIAPLLREGTIYTDMNSVSPVVKVELSEVFASSKGHFVEGAVMGPVTSTGCKVPINVCGKFGPQMAERLNAAGMNISFFGETYGAAAAMKMVKSVLWKGFIALLTETVFAADHYGVTEHVLKSLDHFIQEEKKDYMAACNFFVECMAKDCKRMGEELDQVLETLASMGEDSSVTQGVRAKFRWIEEQGYGEHFITRPNGYAEVLEYKKELEGKHEN